ncbi:hypothetical protein [Chryseobacterium sp.]|uniref:hypothetical protein n=1 Tax=Chryseobacterium sp. TaxID=1871047 RepID=UPI00321AA641
MKNILVLLFCVMTYNTSFAQEKCENIFPLSGTWIGKSEEHPIKFEILEKMPNSFIFSFINFQNERFMILKSDVTTNEKNEFVIQIKEAKLSSGKSKKCIFSAGTITLTDISQDSMRLNLKSVPKCRISNDQSIRIDDITNLILTKEKSNK